MKAGDVFTYIAVGLLALLVICWLANLVRVLMKKEALPFLNRAVYILGMAAALANAVRVFLNTELYRGSMVAANLIAFACVLVAYRRYEKGTQGMQFGLGMDDEEDGGGEGNGNGSRDGKSGSSRDKTPGGSGKKGGKDGGPAEKRAPH